MFQKATDTLQNLGYRTSKNEALKKLCFCFSRCSKILASEDGHLMPQLTLFFDTFKILNNNELMLIQHKIFNSSNKI